MKVFFSICVCTALLTDTLRAAENAACWGDAKRIEISCTPLTEGLLRSFEFAPKARVLKAMKAEGVPFPDYRQDTRDTLHFIGNAKRGAAETGVINISFRDNIAIAIHAMIDQREGRARWNFSGMQTATYAQIFEAQPSDAMSSAAEGFTARQP